VSEIQSLARGLQILDLFAQAENGLSITEIAQHLGVDKSSASRLVKTLVSYQYVQPDVGSRRYILGQRLHQLGWQILNRIPVREQAKPFLYRLVQQTEECAHTAVYSQGKALVIDDVEAESSLRVVGGIGRLLPMHCTAVGKSLLAFSHLPLPDPDERIIRTARTMTDTEMLREHLACIRDQGYALDDEENDPGVRCLAAPVYDYAGMMIAVIGISGPTIRVTPERVPFLGRQVMQAGYDLSRELGFKGVYHPMMSNAPS
jgi:IclR family transcriptional regulator, KDG regulon repressor